MTNDIKGICPIIATPFTANGDVDYDSMQNLLRVLAAGGCHGLTLFGIAGEYYKLSAEEMEKMAELTVCECRKAGVPSIISVTDHATEVAVKKAKYFQELGADCLMLLPPFFLKPGAAAIKEHLRAVGEAVNIPIIVQYAPEQTGVAIAPSIFTELSKEVPALKHFKIECKPPGAYISSILEDLNEGSNVFVGNAGFQLIENMDRGATGAMPGCSMYDLYLKVYNAMLDKDRKEAYRVHNIILTMLNHIRQNVEMIILYEKRILQRRGIIETSYCRKPSFTPDPVFETIFDELYEVTSPHFLH